MSRPLTVNHIRIIYKDFIVSNMKLVIIDNARVVTLFDGDKTLYTSLFDWGYDVGYDWLLDEYGIYKGAK
jgi:hypothetical protein